ncbi:alpha/beta hydrolase [Endozoicomonas acroporae]|uniref:alpha/beta hydrolase n=1 Tax=Endozoicomonas acroporae TaxID=1701104 RepID=UPI003D7A2F56
MAKEDWNRFQLRLLSYLAPPLAGRLATRLFAQSRNEANPHSKALTPNGAKAIALNKEQVRVKEIYLWEGPDKSNKEGDIILLVHGWGANCASMFGFVEPLLTQGYRVAAFDAPAHGSTEGDYTTMAECVAATTAVIDRLTDVGPVRQVVAHSLGGIIAMAACAPRDDIRQMVLIATPFSLLDVLDIWSRGFMQLRPGIRQRILKQLLVDNGVPVSHWDIGLHGADYPWPVKVIHDKDDKIVSHSHAHRIAKALGDTDVHTTEGLDHFRPLINRDVHQQVVDFFQPALAR